MKFTAIIVPSLSALLAIGSAMASPDEDELREYYEQRGPVPFEVMDLDGDGVVTKQEHAQLRNERQRVRSAQGYPMRNAGTAPGFEDIDRDGNGAIDRDELSDWHAQRGPQGAGRRW